MACCIACFFPLPLVFAGFGVDVLLLVLVFLLPWGVDVPPVLRLLSVVVLAAWGIDVFVALLLASVFEMA